MKRRLPVDSNFKMDTKIDGFFQTVIRYLDEVELISNNCSRLQTHIEEHKSQYQMIESVNPSDFNIDSIDDRLKRLLLKKSADQINDSCQKLEDKVSWFSEKSDLLSKKLEKCLQTDQIKNQCLEDGEYITWMSDSCNIIRNHALKVQIVQNSKFIQGEEHAEDEAIDESDSIFQHSKITNQRPTVSFNMDPKDLELLNRK